MLMQSEIIYFTYVIAVSKFAGLVGRWGRMSTPVSACLDTSCIEDRRAGPLGDVLRLVRERARTGRKPDELQHLVE